MLLLCITLIAGCHSSAPVPKTAEELAIARLAVLEMIERTTVAASDNITRDEGWRGTVAELVPPEAAPLVERIGDVPGLPRLMDKYLDQMNKAIGTIMEEFSEYIRKSVLPSLDVPDPFTLIEGQEDAVTRFFAASDLTTIEQWLTQNLGGAAGTEAMRAWQQLQRTYNTYSLAHVGMRGDSSGFAAHELDVDPTRALVVTLIRQLFADMRTQEALVRAMAPAYDDPLIILFAGQ